MDRWGSVPFEEGTAPNGDVFVNPFLTVGVAKNIRLQREENYRKCPWNFACFEG